MTVLSPTASTKDAKDTSTTDAREMAAAKSSPGTTAAATSRSVSRQPRLRASLMATIALAVAVAAILTVATGVLAAPGAALGLLAALFAVGGITATRRRHVTGTGNAALGLVLGLVALAVGTLAITGTVTWLDTTTNYVARVQEWLDLNAPWATPAAGR